MSLANQAVLCFVRPRESSLLVPNSALSTRDSGRTAQSTTTKFSRNLELLRWMALAKSSFPEPVGPVMSTFASLRAA